MMVADGINLSNQLTLGRLSWIIQVGSKHYHMCPLKREAEGDLTEKRRRCDGGGERLDCCRHKPVIATGSWKRQGTESFLP